MSEILVVDDSLTVRMDLAGALEAAGFTVVACATMADARDALSSRPIAVAILDVRLPDGDGVDLLREIRASADCAALPVLMLSSEAEVADRIRGLKTGANDYVGKPYDTELVIARIHQLVAAPRDQESPLVLVIDDSPTFRDALVGSLGSAGYRTAVAGSGTDGLRVALARRPDAVIVDGVMPDMGGDLVIRRLRLDPSLRAIPCLLLTGSDTAAAEIQALDSGADAFARKDGDVEVILARFAAMLRSAPSTGDSGLLLGSKRILAVDDSVTFLHAIADQLHDDGFDVVQATSGRQAIDLLAVQPVDCILLDLVMPGLSGIETCRRIKAAPVVRDIPLIALTSRDGRDSMIEALAAGADDFVSKSAAGDVLGARVKAQIRRKRVADEYRQVRERLLRSEHEATEARAARELAETRAAMAEQLGRANVELATANRELEAFSYSVSHDLRAPLRAIQGFSRILVEDFAEGLVPEAREHLDRISRGAIRMSELIDDLLLLSRVNRADLKRQPVDLSALAAEVIAALAQAEPARAVEVVIQPAMTVDADPRLVKIVLENLLGNAWKFTARTRAARIELFARDDQGEWVYIVRDNGAGFDMRFVDRLFAPFQRLHSDKEFPGTGIGLATVHRIVVRHGGRISVDARVGEGATFELTFAPGRR